MLFLIILDSNEELKKPFLTTVAMGEAIQISKGAFLCFSERASCKDIKDRLEKMNPTMPSLKHFYVFRLDNFNWDGTPHSPEIAQKIEAARRAIES